MGCGVMYPLLALGSYVFALVFNYAATASDWFGDKDVGEVSDKYQLSITPAGWTFAIWGIIYTWQAIWIIYVLVLSCKSVNNGVAYFTRGFWISYIIANLINGVWIAVWISQEITLAALFLIGILVALVISGITSHKWLVYEVPLKVSSNGTESELDNYPVSLVLSLQHGNQGVCQPCCCTDEKQLLYGFVLNGIGIYCTWSAVATCINIGVFFRYVADWSNDASVAVSLTLLIIMIFSYWYCDFIKFRNTLRYTYTPYFVLIWAFLGILSKYSMNNNGSSVVVLIYLIIAIIGSIYKLYDSIKLIKQNNDGVAQSLLGQEL